jgi:alpha-tubulin suppressor-like RCC1 family protein
MKLWSILLFITLSFSNLVFSADYYWVGNSGNWNDLSKWSNISGGPGSAYAQLPGSNDRVFFDGASFDNDGYTVTFNVPSATVLAFIWSATEDVTFSAPNTAILSVRGSYVLGANMTYNFAGKLNLNAVSTTQQDSLKTNGKILLNDVTINCQGTYNLIGNLTIQNGNLNYQRGTFNISNRTIEATKFWSNTQLPRNFTVTDATIRLTGADSVLVIASPGMTLTDSESANIDLLYSGTNTVTLIPGGTTQRWNTLTTQASHVQIRRNFAVTNLNLTNVSLLEILVANTVMAGSVTTDGNCGKYTILRGLGGPATVGDFGTPWTLNFVRLKNINATGAYVANNSFDDGENPNWTINERTGGNTYYWIGGEGDYYDPSHWSTTSGGASSVCFPGPDDIAIFDAASGFSAGQEVTFALPVSLRTMNMSAVAVPITFKGEEAASLEIRLQLTGSSNVSFDWEEAIIFPGKNPTIQLTSNGANWTVDMLSLGNNTILIQDNFRNSNYVFLSEGGIVSNGHNLIFNDFETETETGLTLNFANSRIEVNGTLFIVDSTSLTWNATNSKLTFLHTGNNLVEFSAGSLQYDTVSIQVKNLELFGNNSFNFIDIQAGSSILFENNRVQQFDSIRADGNCAEPIRLRSFNNALPRPVLRKTGYDTTNLSFLFIDNVAADTLGGKVYHASNSDTINAAQHWITTPSADGTTFYWIGNTGSWSNSANWSLTSGGPAGTCIPTFKDTVVFDLNSFSGANQIVTVDIEAYFKVMDWTNSTGTQTLLLDRNLIAADDVLLQPDLTVTGNGFDAGLIFQPNGLNAEFDPANCTFGVGVVLSGNTIQDSLTLVGDFNGVDLAALIIFGGHFNTNDYAVQSGTITLLLDSPKEVQFGSSTIQLSQGFSDESTGSSLDFDAGTSSITIGGLSTDNYLLSGDLDFYDVVLNFSNEKFNPVTGNNSYHNLTIGAGSKIEFLAGTTHTVVNDFSILGTCNDSIYIVSSNPGSPFFFVKAADSVASAGVNLEDVHVSGGALFKTYFSTDLGGNSGWTFDATPATIAGVGNFTNLCLGGIAEFDNTSTAFDGNFANLNFYWNFGDGTTAVGDTSQHEFLLDGEVQVTLISEYLNGCRDTVVETVIINNPIVSLSTSAPSLTVCENATVTFSASSLPTGLQFQFFVNGTGQGLLPLGTNTYVTSSLANNDVVTVETYQAGCIATNTNPLTYTVNPAPTMSLSINTATTICAGQSVTFTAGTADAYRFFRNGNPVGLFSATNTLTLTNIQDGDVFYVVGRNNTTNCTGQSSSITFVVNPLPATTLSQSDADLTICSGETVLFTAIGANQYQFLLNGTPTGPFGGNTWSSSALTNGNTVSVIGQSIEGCVFTAPQTFTYIVNPIPVVTLTSSDADQTICAGELVQFTSGGSSTYQFFVNGIAQGPVTGTPLFSTSSLANNDIVTVTGTTNGCSMTPSGITFTVNPIPAVTLGSSDADQTICFGETVTFTANGADLYTFFVSGNPQGTPSADNTFVTSSLLNGQVVSVLGTSNGCSANAALSFVVNPSPNTSMSSSIPSNTLCEGQSISFTASNAATYEFFVNGVSQGAPSATNVFTSSTLPSPGVTVNVVGYNAAGCGLGTAPVSVTVNPLPTVSMLCSDADNTICAGESVTFTASGASQYQFFVNGTSQGLPSSGQTFTTTSLGDGALINVIGFTNGCSSVSTDNFTMTVNPLPSVTLSGTDLDNNFCAGENVIYTASGATTYEFFVNGVSQSPPSAVNTIDASAFGVGPNSLLVVGQASGCSAQAQVNMLINSTPVITLTSNAPSNTICSGNAVNFTSTGANSYTFSVNSTPVLTNLTGFYSTSGLSNGDLVEVTAISNNGCPSSNTPSITITVLATPIVTLNASQTTSACVGEEITFTAAGATNFNFFVNGISQTGITPNPVFSTSSLTNGSTVTVTGESNGCSANGTSSYSYQIFNYPVVSLSNNISDNLCEGLPSSFTASGADLYVFQVNGINQGVFSPTSSFTAPLNNGDVLTVLGQTNGCASLSGQSYEVTVYPIPAPLLTSSDDNMVICIGEEVTFTASGAMSYEYFIDGLSQGISTNPILETANLEDGQSVTVVGYNGSCVGNSPQNYTFIVLSMDLTASTSPDNFLLCNGDGLSLNLSGGSAYQILVNDVAQGPFSTNTTYTLNGLNMGDKVSILAYSSFTDCTQPFDMDYYVQIIEPLVLQLDGPATFCSNEPSTLFTENNGVLSWFMNGSVIPNETTNSLVVNETGLYSFTSQFGGAENLWAFGNNAFGIFGNGTNLNSGDPVQANSIQGLQKIVAGNEFVAALNDLGQLWIWGLNSSGQLGIGTFTAANQPTLNGNVPSLDDIALGNDFAIAVDATGNLFAWGQNEYGQLGLGNTLVFNFPQFVASATDVTKVSAGRSHTLALKNDGTVWASGRNNFGQLGNGTFTNSSSFVQVTGLSDIVEIEAGEYSSFARSADGRVFAWGNNSQGQLGLNDLNGRSVPEEISLKNIKQVSSGLAHTLFVTTNGKLYATGSNTYGQLGTGSNTQLISPTLIQNVNGVDKVSAGTHHSLILRKDKSVWGSGRNSDLQLGSSFADDLNQFERIESVYGVTDILASKDFSQFIFGETLSCSSNTISINALETPQATISPDGSLLTANSGVSYQWYINNNEIIPGNAQTQLASASGNYTVLVTYSNGCSSLSAPYGYNLVGIDDLDGKVEFVVYPNPSNGTYNLNWSNELLLERFEIIDNSGRMIDSGVFEAWVNSMEIEITQPAGIYFLIIRNSEGMNHTIKLVKQ